VKVALTQSAASAGRAAARLGAEGFDVVQCPLARIERIDGPPLRTEGYDWVVVTSRAGADELVRRLAGAPPQIAAVGPGTAEALREHGLEPALVASRSTQEGLVAEFPRPAGRVLFAGAEGARDVIVRELQADFVPLYRAVAERPDRFPPADLVVLASGSAARSFAALSLELPCVSLGPATSREAQRLGLDVVAEAEAHDLDGLVQAVKLAASRPPASSRS
jgi:uroporphyrinogen III methyltransferase / synthase